MTTEHSRLTRMEQRIIRMQQQITRLEEDAGIEPCENPTPAEQADYDRVLEGQEKGWNLLDHALTEGGWVVNHFRRGLDGDRVEATKTFNSRGAAAGYFDQLEASLRLDLSGGDDRPFLPRWRRVQTFTMSMYGPGHAVREPVRKSEGLLNEDSGAWIINSWKDGELLTARQGMFSTPAEAHDGFHL